MANATNNDIQFLFLYGTGAAMQFKKNYSANKMEGDATQSWCRMRDCADRNKKVENVGSYKKMRAWRTPGLG